MQKLFLGAKKQLFSALAGLHSLKKEGDGFDFARMREYELGDDTRHINWLATAKHQSPLVKVFNAENKLQICVVALLNGSAVFGTRVQKVELIANLAQALILGGVKAGDLVRACIFNSHVQRDLRRIAKPRAGVDFARGVMQTELIGKSIDYTALESFLRSGVRRRSLVILIGDFWGIKTFPFIASAKRHDLVCLVVRDKLEEGASATGFEYLIDPVFETPFGGSVNAGVLKDLRARVGAYDAALSANFARFGIRHAKIYTGGDLLRSLQRVFRGGY